MDNILDQPQPAEKPKSDFVVIKKEHIVVCLCVFILVSLVAFCGMWVTEKDKADFFQNEVASLNSQYASLDANFADTNSQLALCEQDLNTLALIANNCYASWQDFQAYLTDVQEQEGIYYAVFAFDLNAAKRFGVVQ